MINLWTIRRDGNISEMYKVSKYDIDVDYLTSEKSSFLLPRINVNRGDFVLAKFVGNTFPAYFGVVDSYEDATLKCGDLYTLVNFDFPATRKNGPSFEEHAINLINGYLVNDTSKDMHILNVVANTATPHVYQPSDLPKATNLLKYFINAFKKYNIVWEFSNFDGQIHSHVEQRKDTLQLKNNAYDFLNWEVSTTQVGRNTENKILIVDKSTSDSEAPIVLAEYYLTVNNEVVSSLTEDVELPTKTKVYVYDTSEEDAPTYGEIAESELKGNYYSHEINFDLSKKSMLIDYQKLKMGTLASIYYNDKLFQSVLTGYHISSGSDLIGLRFGHVRSRFSELLE